MKIKLTLVVVNTVLAIPFLYVIWLKNEENKYPIKKILYYMEAFHAADWRFGVGSTPFTKAKCAQHHCWVTDRQDLFPVETFDAVLFGWQGLSWNREMPPQNGPNQTLRRPDQRYVYSIVESPVNDGTNYSGSDNYFNWTMSYRADADIRFTKGWMAAAVAPLGEHNEAPPQGRWISQRPPSSRTRERVAALAKPRLVAWMVSSCKTVSRREDYVRELQKYITVDIFGKCGNQTCGRWNSKDCNGFLEQQYKFYLSFENSLCRDYVTEKFHRQMGLDIVPVVRGGADYSLLAPPGSYIDTRDFASPKALALELLRLAGSQELYSQHFWWKDHYRMRPAGISAAMCNLCKALHEDRPSGSYSNLASWWREGVCEAGREEEGIV